MNPGTEVLAKMWFGTDPPIGIVIIENEQKLKKAYIKPVIGNDEEYDIESIIDWVKSSL